MRLSRFALGLLALGSISNCLDPTEIVLEIGTDVSCGDVHEVGIAIGEPGNDSSGFSTVTSNCSSDGGIGSLVVTPSGAGTAVGIRVVMGVDASAETCQPPSYAGCIVARRAISFVPHTPLHLPIELQGSCLGVACSPDSTCFNGACTDAGVPCIDNVCSLPDGGSIDAAPPTEAGLPDAGVVDAGACVPANVQLTTAITSTQTPHIARLNGGYAISWVLGSSQLMTMLVDDAGHNVFAGTFPVAVLPYGTQADAVGSDGTNVLNVYETPTDGGTTLTAVESALDGGMIAAKTIPGSGPLTGALYDGTSQQFIVAGALSGVPTLFEFMTGAMSGKVTTNTLAPTGITVSGVPALYALSFVTSTGCSVYSCSETGQGFTCATTPGYTSSTCTGVRTAYSNSVTYVAAYGNQNVTLGAINANVPPVVVTLVANPSAFQLLATGSSPLHLLWRQAGTLYADTLPTRQPTPTALGVVGYSGTGAGFDAVADDANATSYGVAYVGGTPTKPALMFSRVCN